MSLTRKLSSYGLTINKWLSSKTNGIVVAATDKKNNRPVAIKLFDMAKDSHRSFMISEIDVMSRINHPHVISSLGILSKDNGSLVDYIGIVMPLGEYTLDKLSIAKTDSNIVLEIFYKLATGLAYLHEQNILHLDIKPDNVLINNYEPCWIDFGSSSFVENIEEGIQHDLRLVSPLYRPPENHEDDRLYTDDTDVWSFGLLMFLTITNNLYWDDVNKEDLTSEWFAVRFSKGFKSNNYIAERIGKLTNFNESDKKNITDVLYFMLNLDRGWRISMKRVVKHKVFDNVRTAIVGSVNTITYSNKFHEQHYEIINKFVTWVIDNYEYVNYVAFLTIDMYYRVASYYAHSRDATFAMLAILFKIACKFYEEPPVDIATLNKFYHVTQKEEQLEITLIHQLNGIIYNSPYYEELQTSNELQTVIDRIVLVKDPTIYTTTNVKAWFKELRK